MGKAIAREEPRHLVRLYAVVTASADAEPNAIHGRTLNVSRSGTFILLDRVPFAFGDAVLVHLSQSKAGIPDFTCKARVRWTCRAGNLRGCGLEFEEPLTDDDLGLVTSLAGVE